MCVYRINGDAVLEGEQDGLFSYLILKLLQNARCVGQLDSYDKNVCCMGNFVQYRITRQPYQTVAPNA